jgi:hypothetical protein
MSYYMGIHTLPGFTKEMLTAASPALEKLNGAAENEAHFLRALTAFKEGRVVCEFEAPSKESVAAAYAGLGFPYDAIVEVEAICDNGSGQVVTTDV